MWWRCHRRLIADQLVVAGDTVCHISSDGRASTHRLTPFGSVEPNGQITYPAAFHAPEVQPLSITEGNEHDALAPITPALGDSPPALTVPERPDSGARARAVEAARSWRRPVSSSRGREFRARPRRRG